jgi:hypothetical protein
MSGKALWSGLKAYLGALVAVVLFPIFWMRSLRLARRHAGDDPRAPAKVGLGIVAGVLIAAGGVYVLLDFQEGAIDGMYRSMDTRLAAATGETAYQDSLAAIDAADAAIPVIERNLADAQARNETKKAADLERALNETRAGRETAVGQVAALTPNHELYLRLRPHVDAQDDQAIRDTVAASGLAEPATMQADTEAAIAVKDGSVRDMRAFFLLFVWPSLFGAFLAPVVFALGNVLRHAFVPSDTVGFKPYPGASAAFFLLLGGFGLPAVPFAAWVHLDAERRSREGQIAL